MDGDVAARLEVAVETARRAGERTLSAFRERRFGVEVKADGTEVTEVDRATEAWIRDRVLEVFGGDGVLGEEHGETEGRSGFRWVVDPIDGTISFVRGVPLYGTLVSVERWRGDGDGEEERLGDGGRGRHRPEAGATEGHRPEAGAAERHRPEAGAAERHRPEAGATWESVIGVIAMPALGELVYAGEGGGCWHVARGGDAGSPRRARVSGVRDLRESTVCTTSLDYFAKVGRQGAYERLGVRCGMLRGWSDCYAHVLVATGRVEAAVDPSSIKRWDVAGMPVIMAEAGGRYSDLEGRAGAGWTTGLSTNGLVHEAVLEALGTGI